jgi:hypothetical protein
MQTTTQRTHLTAALVGVLTALLGGEVFAQSTEVGTWKLNVERSTYSPGPAPRSGTTKIEAVGEGRKVTVDQTGGDGSTRHWEYTANLDGRDSQMTGNNLDADTSALTRSSATTIQVVNRKGGKITTTQTWVISADGKTRTNTTTGMNAAGQPVNNVVVFDRQ